MTEQTQRPTSPFIAPLGLLNPLWPAYGLMMGASLHWWALSRLVRFASPVWAFEAKPKTETPVQTPPAEVAPHAEVAPAAEVAPDPQVEAYAEPTAEIAPAIEAQPAAAMEAAFAPEMETFLAPERAVEPLPEPEPATASEPAPQPEGVTAPDADLGPGDVDELTLIRGIGPRVADALVERGVTTFRQLAKWTEKDMHHFDVEMKLLGRSKRYDFLGQAKALASEA